MRLMSSMKKLLLSLIIALVTSAQAQEICPVPEEKILVVFGNGILTSEENSRDSLNILAAALGPTYNNQKLSYDLAYNYTDGALQDLLQSAVSVLVQFDSQVMAWLNHLQLMPDWFNLLSQKLFIANYTINAPELIDHVAKYKKAIQQGQKVLVVSHSQGNLYVNEAKKLLQAELTNEQMHSFSIFAVATPANNVGGDNAPYFTNHRDVILLVPGAMPTNWTLHDAAGSVMSNLERVQAHSFVDTYMSSDYDIKPALMIGIKGQLNSLKDPVPICENYRKHFIGLLAGSYVGLCNGAPDSASIDDNAHASFPNGVVDLSGSNVAVGYVSRQLINTSSAGDNRNIGLSASNLTGGVGGAWSLAGDFQSLMRNSPPMSCDCKKDMALTTIPAPVDIAAKVSQLLRGYRGGFPANKCLQLNKVTNKYIDPVGWQPVSINGTTLSVAANDYDLTAGRISEFVAIPAAQSFSPVDYEPQFVFDSQLVGGNHLFFSYKSFKGLRNFVYDTPVLLTTCTLD